MRVKMSAQPTMLLSTFILRFRKPLTAERCRNWRGGVMLSFEMLRWMVTPLCRMRVARCKANTSVLLSSILFLYFSRHRVCAWWWRQRCTTVDAVRIYYFDIRRSHGMPCTMREACRVRQKLWHNIDSLIQTWRPFGQSRRIRASFTIEFENHRKMTIAFDVLEF